MALDVKVKIELDKPIGNVGSWFPMLYVIDAEATAEGVYKEYTNLEDLETDGFKEDSDVYKAATLMLTQNETPSKFAVLKQSAYDNNTFKPYLEKSWRQIVLVGATDRATSSAEETVAEQIATNLNVWDDKMLFITVTNKASFENLKFLKTESVSDRVFVVYHSAETNAVAAVVGATAGYKTGSFTYKNIIIKGVAPLEMRDTEIEELHGKGVITILEKSGDIVTSEGKVTSGEYADIIDGKDYVIQNITYKIQKIFNVNKKVPYTNSGISMLEAAVLGVLKNAYSNGLIADDDEGNPIYAVNFALRSETDPVDRLERKYFGGKFSFTLAGAIHYAEIVGTVSI